MLPVQDLRHQRSGCHLRQVPPSDEVLRASTFYKLHSELTAPDSNYSLLSCALSASSTGAAGAPHKPFLEPILYETKPTKSVHIGRDFLVGRFFIEGSEFPACADNPGGSFVGILL